MIIIIFIAKIRGPKTKWVFYARMDLKQNIVSFTMVCLHGINYLMYKKSTHPYNYIGVRQQGTIFLSRNILVIILILSATLIIKNSNIRHCFSNVIVLGFKYWTLKFLIVSNVIIIRITIVMGFVLVSIITSLIILLNVIRIVIMVRTVCWLYICT